jgi:hypothetical protein
MKLSLIASSVVLLVAFNACSSSNSPEKVALSMCELAKKADIKGMKELSTPEFAEQFTQIEELFAAAMATEAGKAELDKQISLMSSIDCEASTKVTDIDENTKQVKNAQTAQEFKLTLVENKWKVMN